MSWKLHIISFGPVRRWNWIEGVCWLSTSRGRALSKSSISSIWRRFKIYLIFKQRMLMMMPDLPCLAAFHHDIPLLFAHVEHQNAGTKVDAGALSSGQDALHSASSVISASLLKEIKNIVINHMNNLKTLPNHPQRSLSLNERRLHQYVSEHINLRANKWSLLLEAYCNNSTLSEEQPTDLRV